ncbi:AGRL1-like protein [Mya arenaria]|uniref:AGRL1-like protein n=1 Tax=Mya arenaria TaxID=6604 RepID=A0ABY7EDY8_MYAAR|nr:AGRL1-like protein [Mya arenaria]
MKLHNKHIRPLNEDCFMDFLETASFLIDDKANGKQWQSRIQNNNTGAESLLSVIDEFAIRLYNSRALSNVTITKPNIGENVTTFVGLVYKNLSQAVSTKLDQAENATISSQVLSLHLLPQAPVKLDPEIQLNFQTFQSVSRYRKFCAFWNTTTETWSTSGCNVVSSNASQVQCACSHLTNFALLISPYTSNSEVVQNISMIITYIGSGLSILALIVTIALHAFYWKILRSERECLTMCLCVVLLLANILFLAGIGQTENQTVCRWIAVSLHVVFLTVFFTMLSVGLNVYFAVTVVFKSGKNKLVMYLLVAFVPPIAVVLTAASISKLEGYGTKARMTITAMSVLLPIMGIGWVFGFFAVNKKTQWFQIVFCIFNASQRRMALGKQDSPSDNTKGTNMSETGTLERSEAEEKTTSVKPEEVRVELKLLHQRE